MKTTARFVVVLSLMAALTVLAQTNSVPIPGATNAVPNAELSKLLLAVIVPVVVALAKLVLPKLPSVSLPILAVALGAGADYVGALLGAWQGSFVVGAVLGSAGVGLREVADQLKQKCLGPKDESK
jgi:hypothetical protein